jgi:hypothetical protein
MAAVHSKRGGNTMKPIYVLALAAALAGMTAHLWADVATGQASGKRQHSPLNKSKGKKPGSKLSTNDKNQISKNLKGGGKSSDATFIKYSKANGAQNSNSIKEGANQGTVPKPDAVDTFSKQQGFLKTNSAMGGQTSGGGTGKTGAQ